MPVKLDTFAKSFNMGIFNLWSYLDKLFHPRGEAKWKQAFSLFEHSLHVYMPAHVVQGPNLCFYVAPCAFTACPSVLLYLMEELLMKWDIQLSKDTSEHATKNIP